MSAQHTAFRWDEAAVQLITERWAGGDSASLIARALGGISRSAVLGKLNRLGLLGTRAKTTNQLSYRRAMKARGGAGELRQARERSAKARNQPKEPKARKAGSGAHTLRSLKVDPEFTAPPPVIFDASKAKPWTERTFGECAYPISGEGADTFSCCQPTSGTYCKPHQRIMFDRRPQTLAKAKNLHRWAGRVA